MLTVLVNCSRKYSTTEIKLSTLPCPVWSVSRLGLWVWLAVPWRERLPMVWRAGGGLLVLVWSRGEGCSALGGLSFGRWRRCRLFREDGVATRRGGLPIPTPTPVTVTRRCLDLIALGVVDVEEDFLLFFRRLIILSFKQKEREREREKERKRKAVSMYLNTI